MGRSGPLLWAALGRERALLLYPNTQRLFLIAYYPWASAPTESSVQGESSGSETHSKDRQAPSERESGVMFPTQKCDGTKSRPVSSIRYTEGWLYVLCVTSFRSVRSHGWGHRVTICKLHYAAPHCHFTGDGHVGQVFPELIFGTGVCWGHGIYELLNYTYFKKKHKFSEF